MMSLKHRVTLKNGIQVPAIGQGTWYLGDHEETRAREIEAIQAGVEAGMTLIDTAEMYGNGRSESLVGEAIRPFRREELFLVSKVLPSNAGRRSMRNSLMHSLKRLGTDYLDLYLYHWRGSIPLTETVSCLEELKQEGLIREWGVSNFDIEDMRELSSIDRNESCIVNQVLYHIGSRGIEFSLLPWMRKHNVTLMSYCPLAQGGSLKRNLMSNPVLADIAKKYDASVPEVMLAWNIRDGHTIAIPRSSRKEHTLSNAAADNLELSGEDLEAIDRVFPKPVKKEWLDMQ